MNDKEIVREVIDAFFKEAGFQHGWNGAINEKVAEILARCLKPAGIVPLP